MAIEKVTAQQNNTTHCPVCGCNSSVHYNTYKQQYSVLCVNDGEPSSSSAAQSRQCPLNIWNKYFERTTITCAVKIWHNPVVHDEYH